MDRTQFTCYESFYKASKRIKKKTDQADFWAALCEFALYGKAPDLDKLPDAVAISIELIMPTVSTSRRKAENGKRGGAKKNGGSKEEATGSKEEATGSKPEAKQKQNEASGKLDIELDIDIDRDIGRDIDRGGGGELMLYAGGRVASAAPPAPAPAPAEAPPVAADYRADPAVAEVIRDYESRVNPAASPSCLQELAGIVKHVGPDVCKRAFDIALDEKKPSWSYIRAILRDKYRQGVRCLADWDALDRQRERTAPKRGGQGQTGNIFLEMLREEEKRDGQA